MLTIPTNYFKKQPEFKPKPISVISFILLACLAWLINIGGQFGFASQNMLPFFVRTSITLASDAGLLYVSFRLLRQNGLPGLALGLSVTRKMFTVICWGLLIGIIMVVIIAALLFMFIPFHFISGPVNGLKILEDGISYLVGNTLEELIFRGFLFIISSQLTGWRMGALIMAVPFGLFHLQGTGLNLNGWKIVATTICYSLVFSFSFVLFRSLWAAISVHASANFLLHTVTGLDNADKALFVPAFEKSWPNDYDVSLLVGICAALIIAGLLYLLIILNDKKNRTKSPVRWR